MPQVVDESCVGIYVFIIFIKRKSGGSQRGTRGPGTPFSVVPQYNTYYYAPVCLLKVSISLKKVTLAYSPPPLPSQGKRPGYAPASGLVH